jgi:hypothetical protein
MPFQMPDPGGENKATVRIRLRVPLSELYQVTIQRTSIPDAAGFAPTTSGTLQESRGKVRYGGASLNAARTNVPQISTINSRTVLRVQFRTVHRANAWSGLI